MQIGTHIGIPGLGASPSPGPLPPELTLDDSSGLADWAATFTQGGSAVALADSDTVITDPSADGIDQLVVTGSGIVDGADEVITIGADTFPSNADKSTTEVVGSTTFAIDYVASTKKWTITKDGGGPAPKADMESLIEAMTYENTSGSPTTGDRTFTFVLTDGGQSSNSAVSTITVEEAVVTAPNLTSPGTQYGAQGETITDITIGNSGDAATFAIAGDSPTSGAALTALGLSLNTSNGTISGTLDVAATVDTHTIKVEATNAGGTDSVTFDLVVTAGTTVTLSTTSFTWEQDDGDTLLMSDVGLASATGVVASATMTLADTGAAAGWDDGDDEILAVGYRIFELGTDRTSEAWARGYKFTLAYTASTGVLLITPTDTTDVPTIVMQTLLRTTKFWRLGAGLTPGARTLDVKINDGSGDSNEPTITVTQQVKLTIKVVDYLHQPISGASVTLKDSLAATVDSGTSDGNGEVVLQFTENGADYDLEVTATGKQSYTVTRSIGGNQHICIPMYTHKTTIDASWLADTANLVTPADSNSPYALGTTDTLYQLASNVTRPHFGIVFEASGIGLDFAGYTLTYGNETQISVTNGGFETGDFTGWDTTGAPDASVVANSVTGDGGIYLYDSYCCKFTGLTDESQTIVSDPIAIPEANRPYNAAMWYDGLGSGGSEVTIDVYDDVTETLLGSYTQSNEGNGVRVNFVPTTTNNIRVEVTVTAVGTRDLYVDDLRVRHSNYAGVVCGDDIWTGFSTWSQSFLTSGVNQFAILDSAGGGGITMGASEAHNAPPIRAHSSDYGIVDNLTIVHKSDHSKALHMPYFGETCYVQSCTITSGGYGQRIENRQDITAAISLPRALTTLELYIEGNAITDCPQQGIYWNDNAGSNPTFVRNNTGSCKTRYTNAYWLGCHGGNNVTCEYNTIDQADGYSGRGILIDTVLGWSATNWSLKYNSVAVRERPNTEYSWNGLEATALRIREYSSENHGNLDVACNRFEAYTDADLVHFALGARITLLSGVQSSGIVLSDNIFEAIVGTTDTSYSAKAFEWADSVNNAGDPVDLLRSRLVSNDVTLGIMGRDTGQGVHDVNVRNCELVKSAEGAVRAFATVFIDSAVVALTCSNVSLMNVVCDGGAAIDDLVWAGGGVKEVSVGWLSDVVVNGGGGATVTADDAGAVQVYSGTADGAGAIADIPLVQTLYQQLTSDSGSITTTTKTNHDFTCSKAGETNGTAEVTADRPRYFEMDFDTSYAPPSLNDPGTQNVTLGDTGHSLTLTNSGSSHLYTELTTGPLPDDLTLSGLTISGNVNAAEAPGTYPVVVTAVNAYGSGASSFDYEVASGISVPTIQAGSHVTNADNASTITLNVPAGSESGDILFAFVSSYTRTMATPSGWTLLTSEMSSTIGGYYGYIFYRTSNGSIENGGSEPASYDFDTDIGTCGLSGGMISVNGGKDPASTAPVVVLTWEGFGTPLNFGSITPNANGSLVIRAGGTYNTRLCTDMTQNSHTAIGQAASNQTSMNMMYREEQAEASGTVSFALSSGGHRLGMSVAIEPAGA